MNYFRLITQLCLLVTVGIINSAYAQSNNCSLSVTEGGTKRWDVYINCDSANNHIKIDGKGGGHIVEFSGVGDTRINGYQVVVKSFVGNLDDITIHGGAGRDRIELEDIETNSLNARLKIKAGDGDDSVTVVDSRFTNIRIDLEAGSNDPDGSQYAGVNGGRVGSVQLNGGQTKDYLNLANIKPSNAYINGKQGDDNISVAASKFANILDINTAGGNDEVTYQDILAYAGPNTAKSAQLNLTTGSGSDKVAFVRSSTRYGITRFNLGAGPDSITFKAGSWAINNNPDQVSYYDTNYFHGGALIDGGSGYDSFIVEQAQASAGDFEPKPQVYDNGEFSDKINQTFENIVNF